MSRIAKRFSELASKNRKALITYLVAGDPSLDVTEMLMHKMVASGADLLEIGMPFSDPIAEGAIIQAAHHRALSNSVDLRKVLDTVNRFRLEDKNTPVVLMGYVNPIEKMGYETFARAANVAGLDAVLTVDLPVEELNYSRDLFDQFELDTILLVSPTSPDERVHRIASKAKGFLYSVAVVGLTGDKNLDFRQVENQVMSIRRFSELPIVVGFGIKDPDTAKLVASISDGVVIGSIIVDCIAQSLGTSSVALNKVKSLVSSIRDKMDEVGCDKYTE